MRLVHGKPRKKYGQRDDVWTKFYRNEMLAEQGRKCFYCYQPLNAKTATADHVISRRSGGVTNRLNIRAACYDCNQCKGSKSEREFRALIANPKRGDGVYVFLANFRFKLWTRTWAAKNRLEKMVA